MARFLPYHHVAVSSDDLSWDQKPLPKSSRCSLLIQEVSLLVGLTPDDDHLSSDDGCPLLPDPLHPHDILPLNLSPTKSLAPWNAGPPHSPNPTPAVVSSPHVHPPVGSRDPATPIPRHKRPDASPRRRQGQVFHFDPLPSNSPRRHAVDQDDMFSSPRTPPPKPTHNSPSTRCSSLDRLERSLLKLEAYAPANQRKSRPLDPVAPALHTRPSLRAAPRLKQPHSSLDITSRSPLRAPRARRFSDSLPPLPMPPHQSIAPRSSPAAPLEEDPLEEDHTPGSFMEMDIPLAGEARPKRHTSFRSLKSKEKVKSLASVAKRVSRGVVAWGKSLTGSTKPGAAKQSTTL